MLFGADFFIVCGLLLLWFNFFLMTYVFFIKHDVIIKNRGGHLVLTIASLAAAVGIIAVVLIGYRAGNFIYDNAGVVFAFSLIQLLWVWWYIDQLRGSEQNTTEVIEAIVGVIEAGDPNLEGHSLYVHNLAILFYENLPTDLRLRINPRNLGFAALLIDVGKLGIPKEIINKSGKLTPEERDIMKRHPEIGVKVLSTVESFGNVTEWIRYHHERVDGGGYYHLKGSEIPLESRILAICDTYSAITMNRTYKATMTYEEAISELKLASGTQLDAELVDIFASIPMSSFEECLRDARTKMKRLENESFR